MNLTISEFGALGKFNLSIEPNEKVNQIENMARKMGLINESCLFLYLGQIVSDIKL